MSANNNSRARLRVSHAPSLWGIHEDVASTHPSMLGLMNLGSTCYLNSVTQCLLYTRPLFWYMTSPRGFRRDADAHPVGNSEANAQAFTEEMFNLFMLVAGEEQESSETSRRQRSSVLPSRLQQSFGVCVPEYANPSITRDAPEFFEAVLQLFITRLNVTGNGAVFDILPGANTLLYTCVWNDSKRRRDSSVFFDQLCAFMYSITQSEMPGSKPWCFLNSVFTGVLVFERICSAPKCSFRRDKFDLFDVLRLHVPPMAHLPAVARLHTVVGEVVTDSEPGPSDSNSAHTKPHRFTMRYLLNMYQEMSVLENDDYACPSCQNRTTNSSETSVCVWPLCLVVQVVLHENVFAVPPAETKKKPPPLAAVDVVNLALAAKVGAVKPVNVDVVKPVATAAKPAGISTASSSSASGPLKTDTRSNLSGVRSTASSGEWDFFYDELDFMDTAPAAETSAAPATKPADVSAEMRDLAIQRRSKITNRQVELQLVFKPSDASDFSYELYAFIEHQQHAVTANGVVVADSVHYVAYVRIQEDWYELNDSVVTKKTFADIKHKSAYMLFFQKAQPALAPDDADKVSWTDANRPFAPGESRERRPTALPPPPAPPKLRPQPASGQAPTNRLLCDYFLRFLI